MKIRFQADADLNGHIVQAIRRRHPEIDFRTADEAGFRGLPDTEVLRISAAEGRILVSHDCNTMPVHFAEFIATQNSPGVFLISQDLPVRTTVDELLVIWESSEADEWAGFIQWLPL